MRESRSAFSPSALKIFWHTVKQTEGHVLITGYVAFLLISCGAFCLVEPETFPTYGNAIWCVFQMITTIGFGDIVPQTFLLRTLSVVIGLTSLVMVALVTGIIVNFYNESMRVKRNESFMVLGHQLEHLTELSADELAQIEYAYREFVAQDKNGARNKDNRA